MTWNLSKLNFLIELTHNSKMKFGIFYLKEKLSGSKDWTFEKSRFQVPKVKNSDFFDTDL